MLHIWGQFLATIQGENMWTLILVFELQIKAYYSLQGTGMFKSGLAPKTTFHLYNAGVKSFLLFGSSNIYLTKRNIQSLETCRSKHMKSIKSASMAFDFYTYLSSHATNKQVKNIVIARIRLCSVNAISYCLNSTY